MLKKLLPKAYGFFLNVQAQFSKENVGRLAFQIYCKVRKGAVSEHQQKFLDSAKHDLIDIPNRTLQSYRWHGNGKRIVLVHGWESNTHRWHLLIKKLQEADFEIIAFDAPGHGYSTGKILHHTLYEKALQAIVSKYQPSAIIGHSMGGMTALYHEYLNPNSKVEKIVAIASPSEYQELMRYYQELLSLSKRVMNALKVHIQKEFGFKFEDFSTANFVKTNTKTGLLIHDRLDPVTPYWCCEQVHANWKNSTLITTKNLGHSIQDDNINDQIVSFLKS